MKNLRRKARLFFYAREWPIAFGAAQFTQWFGRERSARHWGREITDFVPAVNR